MIRSLPFSAMFNFRDIGGYAALDGRTVRWRRVFRSDSLHRIDDTDREAFAALGVRTVIDLRRPGEIDRDGRVPHHDGLDYRHVHLVHRNWDELRLDDEAGSARWLADRYLDLAEEAIDGIGVAMAVLADADRAPAVVHCVAGKDRTGVICALTLSLLGVADHEIADDYALSTEAAERFMTWVRRTNPDAAMKPYYRSPAEAMMLFLKDLRRRHGSVGGYARDAGLTAAGVTALREHLLV
jgi:protein-tyrosine phosphatase